MKKILLLGGSHFQVPSVIAAKHMGYHTITCDFLPKNPGHKFADEYYNVSTTDKKNVLTLAKKLKIDGIVCYASDPAAPTAAYVAEKMGLPGQPYHAVDILTHKDRFRNFLLANKFMTPLAKGYVSLEQALADFDQFILPVMIKPTDSSGSKGVSKIYNKNEFEKAVNYALSFSREKKFIIEEYVEKKGYQIAGDGFSVNGKLTFRCFANEHFEKTPGCEFVPIGESFPYNMSDSIHSKIHDEIQRALTALNMKTGAYNFDIRLDASDNVILMEIGPRNGGNLIPQVTKYATGVDMVEYTIKAAMGEDCSQLDLQPVNGFWASYMIHAQSNGIFRKLIIDDLFRENNIIEMEMTHFPGEQIPAFTGSNGTLGTMILKFSSMDEMLEKMDNMQKYVRIELQ